MNALIRTRKMGRTYRIEIDLSDDGKQPRTCCIGADMTQSDCKHREIAAGGALLLAGYSVKNSRRDYS
jgi:hypothetical protein